MTEPKRTSLSLSQEELRKQRFAELDAAHAKQLKLLNNLMRSARLNLRKMRGTTNKQ